MPEGLNVWLGQQQGEIVRTLALELRAGGLGTALLAFALGALHALTPGHGKAALMAYFLGREAKVWSGVRVALLAALLHVLSGFVVFLVLRFVMGQMPSMFSRGPTAFAVTGYGLIVLAGLIMVAQGLRSQHNHTHSAHALTVGIGLLPCPLTISVLGFSWSQSSVVMVGVVLGSLALGISLTIGAVGLLAILARRGMGAALASRLPLLERWSRAVQLGAGLLMATIGLVTLVPLLR